MDFVMNNLPVIAGGFAGIMLGLFLVFWLMNKRDQRLQESGPAINNWNKQSSRPGNIRGSNISRGNVGLGS